MIIFTSDIDWASEEVIQDTLQLFEQHEVKCTLFVTHDSKVIRECSRKWFEVAIHPNFNPLLGGNNSTSLDQIIDDLMELYPEAKGVRSHSMTQSTPILGKFAEKGLLYDANHFLPYQKIQAFKLWNGMWRIPYNWEDDIHYLYQKSFDEVGMEIQTNDLYVFDFHPIHVFLNTDCEQTYQTAKPFYHDTSELAKYKNTTKKGARDMLIKLLK
ncbi:MAG: hypothetical protein ACOVQA_05275, partial [Thermoflexibacteraceae bacterium]